MKKRENLGFVDTIKSTWRVLLGTIGLVMFLIGFISISLDQIIMLTLCLAFMGFIIILVSIKWIISSKKIKTDSFTGLGSRKIEYEFQFPKLRVVFIIALLLSLLIIPIVGIIKYKEHDSKFVVVVIKLSSDKENDYRITKILANELVSEYKKDNDIKIIDFDYSFQNSNNAILFGKILAADLIFWGNYGTSESYADLLLYYKNLNPNQFYEIDDSEPLKFTIPIKELNNYDFQNKLSEEIKATIAFLDGVIKFNKGDNHGALKSFDKAINNPKWSSQIVDKGCAYFYEGWIYAETKKFQESVDSFSNSIEENFCRSEIYLLQGIAYSELHDYDNASERFDYYIKKEPNDPLGYINRGHMYLNKNDYKEALTSYNLAIEKFRGSDLGYISRAKFYYETRDFQKSIDDYSSAIEINTSNPKSYLGRGTAYIALGDYENAKRDVSRSIQIYSHNALSHATLGLIYFHEKNYSKSIEEYSKAIKISPNTPFAYFNRGLTYQKINENQKAINDFENILVTHPRYFEDYFYKGKVFFLNGDYENSIKNYCLAKDLVTNPYNDYILGEAIDEISQDSSVEIICSE